MLVPQPAQNAPDLRLVTQRQAGLLLQHLLEPDLPLQLEENRLHQARPQVALRVGPGIEADYVRVTDEGEPVVGPIAAGLRHALAADLLQPLFQQVQHERLPGAPAAQHPDHQRRAHLLQRDRLGQGAHLGVDAQQVRPGGHIVAGRQPAGQLRVGWQLDGEGGRQVAGDRVGEAGEDHAQALRQLPQR